MAINNEIQYKAALTRYRHLDSLKSLNILQFSEFIRLVSDIQDYEELHYPIEDTDATRSDT